MFITSDDSRDMITYIDSLLNMTNMTGGPFAGRRHGRGQGLSSYLPDQRGTRPSKTGTATRGGEYLYLSCIKSIKHNKNLQTYGTSFTITDPDSNNGKQTVYSFNMHRLTGDHVAQIAHLNTNRSKQ
jgi:hypothetical protein